MPIPVQCICGRKLQARDSFAGTRAECPSCGREIQIPGKSEPTSMASPSSTASAPDELAMEITEFLDPPSAKSDAQPVDRPSIARRMLEALLDPRAIHWMLFFGGGLAVLGLIVWLVSLGLFKDAKTIAVCLGIGSLAILGGGWLVELKTRFKVAGQALTFLGCVVLPLNLWFYHAQDLITLENGLWIGGLVCCAIYIATVYFLKDPLFLYAVEGGVTLTALLLMADLGEVNATSISLFFLVIGIISIHAERAFSSDNSVADPPPLFTRSRFGLPLFWSGHVQMLISLVILFASQILNWFVGVVDPQRDFFAAKLFSGLLTENHLLAAGMWLAAVYTYFYSDMIVRKIGYYAYLAGFSLLMTEVTLLIGLEVSTEWTILVLGVTGLTFNLVDHFLKTDSPRLANTIPRLAVVLSAIPVLMGGILHLRATGEVFKTLEWTCQTNWLFVIALVVVGVCNRISAWLCRHKTPVISAVYFFFSAGAMLVAAAGLLRMWELTEWYHQAPLLMLIPIAYLIASRMWRGHSPERPLHWVAQVSTTIILIHTLLAGLEDLVDFLPIAKDTTNLFLGLVFSEATLFYVLAAIFRRRGSNVYLAGITACGALWQFMGYAGIATEYQIVLFAVLGMVFLVVARGYGLEPVTLFQRDGDKKLVVRGRGLAPFQCGLMIMQVSFVAALLQGLHTLTLDTLDIPKLMALCLTMTVAGISILLIPNHIVWRRVNAVWSVGLGGLVCLTLVKQIDLSAWQKLEIFAVVVGVILLVVGHISRFREEEGETHSDLAIFGIAFGSLLTTVPLGIAVFVHYLIRKDAPTFDDFAILTITIIMVATGYIWKVRDTTLIGGGALTCYLVILIASLARMQQVAVGVYLAVGGVLIFASGVVLSIYREKLMELPEKISNREGIFRIFNWR